MADNLELYRQMMSVSHLLRHSHGPGPGPRPGHGPRRGHAHVPGHGHGPGHPKGKPPHRMAPGQHRVLAMLESNGPMAQRDLTAALGVSPAALSELLTKLEERGLVERERSKDDRRVTLVSLTAQGKKQARAMVEAEKKAADEVFGVLSEADRIELARILGKIVTSSNA